MKKEKRREVHLPPYHIQPLTRLQALKELTNWSFRHFEIKILWEYTQAIDVPIAVLDTGKPLHKDIDVEEAIDFTGEGVEDENGHATWVAGCIRAVRNFLGIAPKCKLYTAKILDNNGNGAWLWMKKGLLWAEEKGCQVVNISAGGEYTGEEIQPILKRMADAGILIVCAAGNSGALQLFPSIDPNTLAVGAVDKELEKASFSNFGPRLIVMAPGVDLLGCWLKDGYAKASGTSMACPGVSGILGLERQLRPMNLVQAVTQFARTCTEMEEEGWDPNTGWGLIDPHRFLQLKEKKKTTWGWLVSLFMFLLFFLFWDKPSEGVKNLMKRKKRNG